MRPISSTSLPFDLYRLSTFRSGCDSIERQGIERLFGLNRGPEPARVRWLRSLSEFQFGLGPQCILDLAGCTVGRGPYRVVGQVSVDLRSPRLAVTEDLSNDIEAFATADGDRGEAVPEVLQSEPLEFGQFNNLLPDRAETDDVPVTTRCREDKGAPRNDGEGGGVLSPDHRAERFWHRSCCRGDEGNIARNRSTASTAR